MPERQPDPADPEQPMAPSGCAPPTGSRVLLLNATFEPLAVVTAKRAVVLMLTGKAECVQAALEGVFHSESLTIVAPSVMRLSRYVRVPYRRPVPLTRAGVLRRDGRRCAYCARRADTIDHVVPRPPDKKAPGPPPPPTPLPKPRCAAAKAMKAVADELLARANVTPQ